MNLNMEVIGSRFTFGQQSIKLRADEAENAIETGTRSPSGTLDYGLACTHVNWQTLARVVLR